MSEIWGMPTFTRSELNTLRITHSALARAEL